MRLCGIFRRNTGKDTITITLKSGLEKNIEVTVQKKAIKTKKITGVAKKLSLKSGNYTIDKSSESNLQIQQ